MHSQDLPHVAWHLDHEVGRDDVEEVARLQQILEGHLVSQRVSCAKLLVVEMDVASLPGWLSFLQIEARQLNEEDATAK